MFFFNRNFIIRLEINWTWHQGFRDSIMKWNGNYFPLNFSFKILPLNIMDKLRKRLNCLPLPWPSLKGVVSKHFISSYFARNSMAGIFYFKLICPIKTISQKWIFKWSVFKRSKGYVTRNSLGNISVIMC